MANAETWNKSLAKQRERLGVTKYNEVIKVLDYSTFDNEVQSLTTRYNNKTFTKCVTKLSGLFQFLRTFTAVISTMVQANPAVAALVWGSVLVLLEVRPAAGRSCPCKLT
jgi:hypothetical protein